MTETTPANKINIWLGIAVAILTLALGFVTLSKELGIGGDPLRARASYERIVLPPSLTSALELDSVVLALSPQSPLTPLTLEGEATRKAEDQLRRRAIAFAEKLSPIAGRYAAIRGLWEFEIENDSRTKVEGAGLRVPSATHFLIEREGMQSMDTTATGPITIGTLMPGEKLHVSVWTDERLTLSMSENIGLFHNGGIGDVTILKKVGKAGQYADAAIYPLLWTAAILVFVFFLSRGIERAGMAYELRRTRQRSK